jgi:hypothetical protein
MLATACREALAQPHVTRASFLYGYFCGDGNISETVDGGVSNVCAVTCAL